MGQYPAGRRDFLKTMTALGASLPIVGPALRPRSVYSADRAASANTGTAYDPLARFEIKVSEVEVTRADPWVLGFAAALVIGIPAPCSFRCCVHPGSILAQGKEVNEVVMAPGSNLVTAVQRRVGP